MEKNKIASLILLVCVLCLFAGIIVIPIKQKSTIASNINSRTYIPNSADISEKVALINVDGTIEGSSGNSYRGYVSVDNFITALENAQKDFTVKAILIRINSPGGTVAASQDMYDAVMRARAVKPVVVSMSDVAASGGYYIASAADRIVAQKGTMTGSIGVIFNFVDYADLTNKIGITSNVIKSGKFKDTGSPYRKMRDDEQQLFQNSVNVAYGQFVSAITEGRVKRHDTYKVPQQKLTVETLKKYADGRVFLGDEAYKLGFVDKVGSQHDALLLASQMAGKRKALKLVSYNHLSGFQEFLMSMESKFGANKFLDSLPFSVKNNRMPLMIWE